MFPNLSDALKDKGITLKAVAILIGCTEKTLQNKMNGITEFTLSEALLINENLLPEFRLQYLFSKQAA